MNLHPGALAALLRLDMDELDIARAMAAGDLASPQTYMNVTLYNMRLTGTGFSYRPQHDEHVYRDPDVYLNEDFLARCNGLPLIMVHPKKNLLTSKEFGDRIVGTVMLPYIREDEVWAICKVYDAATIELLSDTTMSTSPAVSLGKSDKLLMPDGSKLLLEGKPRLLDHLAIVAAGVWDKGGDPTGIEADIRGDSVMAEEKDKDEKKDTRSDAEKRADEKMDLILKRMGDAAEKVDACMKRMDAWDEEKKADAARRDAFEKAEKEKADAKRKDEEAMADAKRKDAEGGETEEAKRLAADKARKDAEEKEKDKERDDSRADALPALQKAFDEQKALVAALIANQPKQRSDADITEMTGIQSRGDEALAMHGKRAPRYMDGETPMAYRRRIAELLKPSSKWKDIPLDGIRDDAFVSQVEGQIYADAANRAALPGDLEEGQMREIKKVLPSGHTQTEFVGNGTHFVKRFTPPRLRGGVRDPRELAR